MVDLIELAERCERAEGPDYQLDGDIARAMGWSYRQREGFSHWQWYSQGKTDAPLSEGEIRVCPPAYTTSIDAALSLVPEGWCFEVTNFDTFATVFAGLGSAPKASAGGDTPALALCAAALKARAAHPAQPSIAAVQEDREQ